MAEARSETSLPGTLNDDVAITLSNPHARLEAMQAHKFQQCVYMEDYDEIERCLRYAVPNLVNLQDISTGMTALHIAARDGKENMVTTLLTRCAALPDEDDRDGRTPMMLATENGHEPIVDMLLERGAKTDAVDSEGKSVIFYALCPSVRHCNILEILVEKGADCNAMTGAGSSVLCEAAEAGYDEILAKLLDLGADPDLARTEDDATPLIIATMHNRTECVKLLCATGADVNAVDKLGQSAMHKAADTGSFECLQILSSASADMSLVDSAGNTALHLAIELGDLLIVKFLMQRGCPPGLTNAEGKIPKKLADEFGFKAISKEVKKATTQAGKLASGTKPKNYSELWQIRLFDWLQLYKTRMLEQFNAVDANAEGTLSHEDFGDVMKRLGLPLTEDNIDALAVLLDKKKTGVVDYKDFPEANKYINKQYQLTAKDRDGKAKKGKKGKKKGKKGKKKKGGTKIAFPIPFFQTYGDTVDGHPAEQFVAKHRYVSDEVRFPRDRDLQHAFADDSMWYVPKPDVTYVSVFDAVRHSDLQTLRLALLKKTSPDVRDRYNKTPMMYAAASGRMDSAMVLHEFGADLDVADNFGWTPLHHACHHGQTEIASWLMDNGADINKCSKNGGSPLMRAVESSKPEIVRQILARKPNLKVKNANEQDVLQVAKLWADNVTLLVIQEAYGPEPEEDDSDDKKKKGKKGKKGKDKKDKKGKKDKKKGKGKGRASSAEAPTGPVKPPFVVPSRPHTMPTPEMVEAARHRRVNICRAMSPTSIHPAKLFQPRSCWDAAAPVKTVEYIDNQQALRGMVGEDVVDFGEERSPFQINLLARVKVVEADA